VIVRQYHPRHKSLWTNAWLVDFDAFSKVLNRPGGFRDPGEPEEYCRGFQVFDKDMTGFIGVGQLRYILTNLGEKMTEEEVDELLKAVDTSSGQVNYTGRWPLRAFLVTAQTLGTGALDETHSSYGESDLMANLMFSPLQTSSGRFSQTRHGPTRRCRAMMNG